MMIHHARKNIRLKGYDYQSCGAYFVTICTKCPDIPLAEFRGDVLSNTPTVDCVTGDVLSNTPTGDCVSGDVILNSTTKELLAMTLYGQMVADVLVGIPDHAEGVILDEWIVMPDHVHILIWFAESIEYRSIRSYDKYHSKISPPRRSLGVVVRQFKATVTCEFRKKSMWSFKWQRGYYDRIVRDENELNRIRHYIRQNPQKLLDAQIRQKKTNDT